MKILKTLVVIFFLVIGGLILTSQNSIAAKDNLTTADENAKEQKTLPRDLYVRNCARCHGADGKGDTPKGRELAVPDLTGTKVQKMSRARIAAVIRSGKDDMPAFGKKLSKAEINSLTNLVRAF